MRSLGIVIILLLGVAVNASAQDVVKWVFTNYPPANFQTQDNEFSGFFHDIVIEVFNKGLGIGVAIEIYPWKRCQAMVKNGSADIMVTIPTSDRLAYAVTHSRPIWIKRRILYTYHNHPDLANIQQLNSLAAIKNGGYRVVSYLGNGWIEKAVMGIDIPVVFATSVDGMYRMLAAQRGDLIIEEKSLAAPRIAEQRLSGKIIETSGVGSESGFHILIGKQSRFAHLIARVDREVETMRRSGRLDQIVQRYTTKASLSEGSN